MKTQIQSELSEEKKAELKKEIDDLYATEHDKKIEWSTRERGKFVESLKTELDKKESSDVLKLIQNEIENELTENEFDKKAEDYEGYDNDGNEARQTIENAWETNTQNLSKSQKANLQKRVAAILEIAHADKDHDIFEGVEDRAGRELFKMKDKMVTKAEATKIAEFIATEAKIMEQNEIEAKKKIETLKKPNEIPKAPTEKLRTTKVEKWATTDANGEFPKTIPEENQEIVGKIVAREEWKKVLAELSPRIEKFGINRSSFETALKNFVGQNPNWLVNSLPLVGLTGVNAKNKNFLEKNLAVFEKHFSGNKKETQLENFFKLKGVKDWKENPDWLIRYCAFNEVAEDLKTFEEWNKAREKNNENGEIKLAEQKTEIFEAPKSVLERTSEKLGESSKKFSEAYDAFKKGDWGTFFSKVLEALFMDGIWESVKGWISGIPLVGPIIVAARDEQKKAETVETPTEKNDPLLNFLEIETKDTEKLKSLNNISLTELLATSPNKFEKFAKDKQINLDTTQLTKLQNQLKPKTIDAVDKDKKVFDLISEKPELLA
ncbi:hypothetical protein K9N08_01320 [Candidatus Gracilibacteria bacterium]|nr:hypothetical protein [Candidatus Gracilibacteria bacterium]MCF7856181.1 hypothetical protein [Candidatus Gracilibacteria bacterium]MCF7896453.1 hypothetical protein [Candidatus Gracilibacteria bacterium]